MDQSSLSDWQAASGLDARDGSAGGIYTLGQVATDNFFRLFGDSDGDRDVDVQDLGAFGASFRKTDAESEYDPRFDFDSDGDVDVEDLGKFGIRFRSVLDF